MHLKIFLTGMGNELDSKKVKTYIKNNYDKIIIYESKSIKTTNKKVKEG